MKPTYLISTLLGCAGMFSVAHAGTLNPEVVSADAKWLLHYDADAAKGTAVGEHMLDKMSDVDRRRLQAVKRLLSINPVEDVKSITLYGSSVREDDAILVVRVDHDAAHVADLIAAADNYSSKSAGNQVIHQIDCGRGHTANIVLLNDEYLVAAGSEQAVRRGSALISGSGKSMKGSDIAAAFIKAKPVFAAYANLERLEMRSRSAMAREVSSMTYWLAEEGDSMAWHLKLSMKGKDTANMVGKMAEGMLEYAKKQKKAEHPWAQKALAAVKTKVDGSTVYMGAKYSNKDIIVVLDFIEAKVKEHKKGSGWSHGFGRKGSCDKCPSSACPKEGAKGDCDKCPKTGKCDKPDCKACEKKEADEPKKEGEHRDQPKDGERHHHHHRGGDDKKDGDKDDSKRRPHRRT